MELACIPSAIPANERAGHFALARELFSVLAQERLELPNGFAVSFPPESLVAVARFVENERKCCPFMDFAIDITRDSGPMWLRMTGPAGTREILQAELGLTGGCGC